MKKVIISIVALAVGAWGAGWAQATVVIDTVPVGNPGNAGELSGAGAGGYGPDRICGAVDYVYNIGKYEVTAGQYTAFLNAVAATDTYGLYRTSMWSDSYGCKIQRSGSPGSYTYSVAQDWADRPVNWVSWGDSARFANWLHNGQPTGGRGVRDAWPAQRPGPVFLAGHIPDGPGPVTQRLAGVWEEGSRRDRGLMPARAAFQPLALGPRLVVRTPRATECLRPSQAQPILPPGRLARESLLPIGEIPGTGIPATPHDRWGRPESIEYPL